MFPNFPLSSSYIQHGEHWTTLAPFSAIHIEEFDSRFKRVLAFPSFLSFSAHGTPYAIDIQLFNQDR
jgi:hypothetical protein